MKITEFSFPCTVMVAAYGYELSLVSVIEGEGILFTADLRKEEINQDFNQLPETDKNELKKTIGSIKNPEQEADNISEYDVSILTQALNRINVKNIAYYWDRTNSKGLFYLELKLDLSNTVSLFKGNFEVDYLLLDLIISTGDKEVTDEDRARKEKIKGIRAEIWNASEKENQMNQLIQKIHKNGNQLNQLIQSFHKKEFQFQDQLRNFQKQSDQYSKSMEGVSQRLSFLDNLKEKVEKNYADNTDIENFNKTKSNEYFSFERDLLRLKENTLALTQNEQNTRYSERAFAQFKQPNSSFFQREKDLEIMNEKFNESQVLEKQSFQIRQIPLLQANTFEEQIIKLKEDKINDFKELKLIEKFDNL